MGRISREIPRKQIESAIEVETALAGEQTREASEELARLAEALGQILRQIRI